MHNENIYEVLFRAWHDEAYLYINQAITQEKPNIDRKDVALMMYQKGLGLLDLALCVDTEVGRTWTIQVRTHGHVAHVCNVVSGYGSSLSEGEDDAAENGEDSGSCGVKDQGNNRHPRSSHSRSAFSP